MKLSYSAIDTYETCPAKYKFQYEDKLPRQERPALAFGDILHRVLYRFHNRPVPVAPSLGDLHEMLQDEWSDDGYRDEAEAALYRDHAWQILADYHHENAEQFRIPAALEHRFVVDVDGVQLQGVIDRMDRIPGGGYEIIDYKTSRRLPAKQYVDADLQLSLYYLAAREIWGIEAERLTLYYLIPGQRMSTFRTPEMAEDLRKRVATVAERIEAGKFEPRQNPLCDWCDFQAHCPLFKHMYEKLDGDPAPRMTGIVDEWISLKRQDWETYRRLEDLKGLINAFCEEHGYRRLFGSDGAAIDRRPQHITSPDERRVREILEPLGLWEQVIGVDPKKLSGLVESRRLPPNVEDALLASREEVRTQYSLYLRDPARSRR